MNTLASPPPMANGLGLGNFNLPKPPPGVGSKIVKGVGGALKPIIRGGSKIVGGTGSALALELLFPPSTAKSGLDQLPKDFFNSGTGNEIQPELEGGEPRKFGSSGETYTFDVIYTRTNTNTQQTAQYQRGSYTSYGQFSLVKEEIEGYGVWLKLFRSPLNGVFQERIVTSGGSTTRITNYSIINIRTSEGMLDPPDDRIDNPGVEPGKPPIRTVSGISNLPDGFSPSSTPSGGYSGGQSNTGDSTSNPVSLPPSIYPPNSGGNGIAGESNTGSGGSSVTGGQGSGSQSSGSAGSGTIGGSGAPTNQPSGIPGGVVTGNTTGSGTQPLSPGNSTTGSGVNVGSPSETAVSSPTNTGNNTAAIPTRVPILSPSGIPIGSTPTTPQPPDIPGTLPFPPIPGIDSTNPGDITKPGETNKPAGQTPPPPDKEPKPDKEEPRIVPIPFDLRAKECCPSAENAVKELALDLECVIEKICVEEEELLREFLKITITKDPFEKYILNPSTNGLGETIYVAGYINWIVRGTPVAPQIPIRKKEEMILIPDWAEGWEPYPCNGAEFLLETVLVDPNNP